MSEQPLSDEELKKLRAYLDKSEIDDVINAYYHAMDARRFDLLSKVFAPDVVYTAQLIGFPKFTYTGYDEVVASIHNVANFRSSHHGVRNRSIEIHGDEADVVVVAMDALLDVNPRETDFVAGCRVVQHGLRYTDKFVRRPEGWRIRRRELVCLWQQVTVNPTYLDPLPF